ncbi:MAG: hypothetical protein J4N95_02120 [Chloroflexi bacterium]|nr:hypothetical protein [Chloroflexota bacterium]
MKLYLAALGSFIVGAVVLVSIFVIVPAITDDDTGQSSTATLAGVHISTASTNENGGAFFDGSDGEQIQVLVHRPDGTAWDNVDVHYLDGDGYQLFIAEDRLGRFLPSWAFYTQTNIVDLTTRVEGLVEVVPDTDQFNAIVPWIDDVKAGADVRHCVGEQQLADESDTSVALTSATLSPLSSLAVGVGTARNSLSFLADIIRGEPSEALFDVFEFHLEGIATTFRHYDVLTSEECEPEPTVGGTPLPADTPRPGQPAATPLPESPTATGTPGQATGTPGQLTGTPGPDQPTGTPGPRPTDAPPPQPTDAPPPRPTDRPAVAEDFMRITDIQPPLGTTIAEHAIISVTVEYRVSSVVGVSISGLADLDVNLLSLGIYTLADTQGTLKLRGEQFIDAEARLCAVSITMEGPSEQLASDSRGYVTPVC